MVGVGERVTARPQHAVRCHEHRPVNQSAQDRPGRADVSAVPSMSRSVRAARITMRARRSLLAGLLALGLAPAGLVGAATPARAAETYPRPSSGSWEVEGSRPAPSAFGFGTHLRHRPASQDVRPSVSMGGPNERGAPATETGAPATEGWAAATEGPPDREPRPALRCASG